LVGIAANPLRFESAENYYQLAMVTITFPDRETEKRALAFLLGRFSGRVLRSGEHIVPEAALEALADQNIPFSVIGRTTYEQQMAAIRGPAPTSVQ
jgi:DNA-binding LacI/PurR family transcriptional regulator